MSSSGERVGNSRFPKRAETGLRRKRKALPGKMKGQLFANFGKARALMAKAHERTACARNGLHYKLSRRLVDGNHAVCAETPKAGAPG